MSNRKLFRDLLAEEWIEDASKVTGRVRDVRQPTIIAAKEQKRHDLTHTPLLVVKDGGATDVEAMGLGWQEEKQTSLVQLTMKCLDTHGGETYMNGYRAGPSGDSDAGLSAYEKEDHGGMAGEVKRILDKYRKGVAEYQLVDGYEFDDISETMGYGRYRVDANVRLHGGVEVID